MAEVVEARGLTLRQRRDMGLTIVNITQETRKMMAEGVISKSTPKDEVAELVLERLVFQNPRAFGEASIDWDAVLAFIEKLLPLILTIIGLF